jgi:glutaredoxin
MGLIIEVFDWKKLDSVEEAYRTGLLSLIDNEIELAEMDLLKGVNGGIADASFFLGSINLNKGKINTALKLFRFADLKKTTINDNYIALNQIYIHKKQNSEAEKYAKIYKANTGSITIPTIQFPQIIESGEQSDYLTHIDSVLNVEQKLVDAMPDDTTEIDTNKVEVKDTTTIKKEESIWEAENHLLLKYAIGIAIALVLFVIYLYLKWRNKQLRVIEEQKLNPKSNQQVQQINQVPIQKKNKAD